MLPYTLDGQFAAQLSKSRKAALTLFAKIKSDERFIVAFPPELDIIVWTPRASSVSVASQLAKNIFAQAAEKNLHLAIANLPIEFFNDICPEMERDQEYLTCLRSCLLKPEHLDWIDDIWQILQQATDLCLEAYNTKAFELL